MLNRQTSRPVFASNEHDSPADHGISCNVQDAVAFVIGNGVARYRSYDRCVGQVYGRQISVERKCIDRCAYPT